MARRQIPVTGAALTLRCRGSELLDLDAIVLADDPLARVRIAGLDVRERAIRVTRRVGACRVLVIDRREDRAGIAAWRAGRSGAVVVIRADQLVHTPLVQPLIEALPCDGVAMAAVPESSLVDDLAPGSYAGAFAATGAAANAVVSALASGAADTALVDGAIPVAHGAIARAPVATSEQRRSAHHLLYKILVKPQDNAVTRYLYRPVSFPLTRWLVKTPITPNQVSYIVAALVVIGCWLTAHASMRAALAGTIVVLIASYVDCCDGEIARLKLLSSKFGAWLDTIVDELSSLGYMVALGWHCHLRYGAAQAGDQPLDRWQVAIAASLVTYAWSIYCVYYNIIVAVGSANSQDYVGRFEVVAGTRADSVRLVPVAPTAFATKREWPPAIRWLLTYAPYIVRRDFIAWFAVALVAMHATQPLFFGFVFGGFGTSVVLAIDHFKLRSLQRAVARRGQMIEDPRTAAAPR